MRSRFQRAQRHGMRPERLEFARVSMPPDQDLSGARGLVGAGRASPAGDSTRAPPRPRRRGHRSVRIADGPAVSSPVPSERRPLTLSVQKPPCRPLRRRGVAVLDSKSGAGRSRRRSRLRGTPQTRPSTAIGCVHSGGRVGLGDGVCTVAMPSAPRPARECHRGLRGATGGKPVEGRPGIDLGNRTARLALGRAQTRRPAGAGRRWRSATSDRAGDGLTGFRAGEAAPDGPFPCRRGDRRAGTTRPLIVERARPVQYWTSESSQLRSEAETVDA